MSSCKPARLAAVGSDLLPSRSRTGREPSSARTQDLSSLWLDRVSEGVCDDADAAGRYWQNIDATEDRCKAERLAAFGSDLLSKQVADAIRGFAAAAPPPPAHPNGRASRR